MLAVANSTITRNTATDSTADHYGSGGGVRADFGSVRLRHATLAGNAADSGANVSGWGSTGSTFASVLTNPLGGGTNCSNAVPTSIGYNHATDGSCGLDGPGDVANGADPQLMALGDYGGPTHTRPPLASSPLVDAIPNAACDPTLTTDQRARPRPFPAGGRCDTGAVEADDTTRPRPDGRIKKGATGTLKGDNVYNTTGEGQTRTGSAARGRTVTYYASAQNDAAFPDVLRLQGTASNTRFTVQYSVNGVGVTRKVTAGTYTTPTLAPGAVVTVKVVVTVRTTAPAGSILSGALKVRSDTDLTVRDTVKFVTSRA